MPFVPTGSETRINTDYNEIYLRALQLRQAAWNDAMNDSRKRQAHLYVKSSSSNVKSRKGSSFRRISNRLLVLKRRLQNCTVTLYETQFDGTNTLSCTAKRVWSQYSVLNTNTYVYEHIRPTWAAFYLVCPPCGKVYPEKLKQQFEVIYWEKYSPASPLFLLKNENYTVRRQRGKKTKIKGQDEAIFIEQLDGTVQTSSASGRDSFISNLSKMVMDHKAHEEQ